jgi:succinoglycan biosynthesis protein ExoM
MRERPGKVKGEARRIRPPVLTTGPVLISIVIPTFRRPDMLAGLLATLGPQLTADTEAVIVDNDPAASARDVVAAAPGLRYVHEPRPGVVHARNRGVAEARGRYILFLDDDELPGPHWLAAFETMARAGAPAAFGRIVPRYAGTPPAGLVPLLDALFSRELGRAQGADITDCWPYLGTGNAMFDRAVCFPEAAPFDPRFNTSGGEDVWLIRGLVRRGVRLAWNRDGLVEELVPASRMTLDYLKDRKFANGQQRVIFNYGEGGGEGVARAALWMGVGAVQAVGYGTAALLMRVTGSPRRLEAEARVQAGLGKLLWRRAAPKLYG